MRFFEVKPLPLKDLIIQVKADAHYGLLAAPDLAERAARSDSDRFVFWGVNHRSIQTGAHPGLCSQSSLSGKSPGPF